MKAKDKGSNHFDVVIIGGLGHVGLPLGLVFAQKGLRTCLYDVDTVKAKLIKKGIMPFLEHGAEPILKDVIKKRKLTVSLDEKVISKGKYVVIALGTPVDEYLTPKTRAFLNIFVASKKYLHKDQVIIVRSTIYPHTCRQILKILGDDAGWRIAYCPERIVQGYAVKELNELPQVVAGMDKEAEDKAVKLFGLISPKIIRTSMGEAELVKLFSNAWRYIQFAVTNQFYMIARNFGVDYNNVRHAMTEGYGRAATLPTAGFAAGPCLLKDTMQLSAFSSNNFILGHAAMMINEGLPNFIIERLKEKHDLRKSRVGILGMAFKAETDDIRDSLSYKLGKILRFHGAEVFYSDEYAKNPDFVSKEKLVKSCDVVIVGVPHSAYKGLFVPKRVEVIDLWGVIKEKDAKK